MSYDMGNRATVDHYGRPLDCQTLPWPEQVELQEDAFDVFLLGAGFSRAISSCMPLMCDLNGHIRKVMPEVFHFGNLGSSSPVSSNVELLLTYLASDHPWQEEQENLQGKSHFLRIQKEIASFIDECETEALEVGPPWWLRGLHEYWCRDNSTLISLNYDTLVEACFLVAEDGPPVPQIYSVPIAPAGTRTGTPQYSGPEPQYRLLKLHGSTNWYYSGGWGTRGEQVFCTRARRSPDSDLTRAEAVGIVDKSPLIVPPVMDKTLFYMLDAIRASWWLAGRALRQARQVFCVGYSLPETDLAMSFFLNSNHPSKRCDLYVVNEPGTSGDWDRLMARYKRLLSRKYFRIHRGLGVSGHAAEHMLEFLEGSQAAADLYERYGNGGRDA